MSTAKVNEFPFHVPSLFPHIHLSLQGPGMCPESFGITGLKSAGRDGTLQTRLPMPRKRIDPSVIKCQVERNI